ncbi:MAG: hypothetical protein M3R02_16990 [Chloroflexota bacterium]|nr:hypothetical protein [Chloroflexota bacterium]
MEYIARLDKKTGLKVLCSHPNCGQIATITEIGNLRRLHLPSGYRLGENGVWAPGKYARESVKYGRPAQDRRGFVNSGIIRGARIRGERIETHPERHSPVPDLTTTVICPYCGHPNFLDPDRLLITDPYQRVA